MNWGYKIALTFTAFVGIMIFMVIKSFQQNIDLVTENYYQEELQYEKQIIKLQNLQDLDTPLQASLTSEGVLVNFPGVFKSRKLEGEIKLYRPSQASRDKTFQIKLDEGLNQLIDSEHLAPGKYLLKVDFTDGVKSYFQEIPVFIPGV